jgi:signal transduction histidine kinase
VDELLSTLAPSRPPASPAEVGSELDEDVDGRRRLENEGARVLRQQRALASLGLELSSGRSFDDLLQLVTDRARDLVGADMAVTSQTIDGDWGQAVTSLSVSERFAAHRSDRATPDGSGVYRLVCERNRPMRLTQEELESHPDFRGFGTQAADHPPLHGWLAAPLVGRDGSNLGLIQASHKRRGEFTAQDEAVLVQVAQMAAAVIEDRLLRSQLEEQVRKLDASLATMRRMHEDRRRLIGQLVSAQEEERARLAKDLHDDPLHVMTAVSMRLEILRRRITSDELPDFELLQRSVTDAVTRLRHTTFELRPLALDDGLASALNHYLFEHDLIDDGFVRDLFETEPTAQTRAILYRIGQEALTNIGRYAGGCSFEVVLSERDGGHMLEVRDQGPGFDPVAAEAESDHMGLASMRERAELAGGWLVIHSGPGAGTHLRAWVPRGVSATPAP